MTAPTDHLRLDAARARMTAAKRALTAATEAIHRREEGAAERADEAIRELTDAHQELTRLSESFGCPFTVRPREGFRSVGERQGRQACAECRQRISNARHKAQKIMKGTRDE